jgi:carboxyl-terminal processing protease
LKRVIFHFGLFLLGVLAGVGLDRYWPKPEPVPPVKVAGHGQEFHLVTEAWNAIRKNYVDQSAVRARRFTYESIRGMVDALGDTEHSMFLTPAMRKEEKDEMDGEFAGIGVHLEARGKRIVIASLFDNSPAQRNGLKPGDVVLAVEKQRTAGMSAAQVLEAVRGPAGSLVDMDVLPMSQGNPRHLTLTREKIGQSSVGWAMVPGSDYALVRISVFSAGTSEALEKALAGIGQTGAKGMVLDLRDNPGGYFDEAVGVASQFLRQGNVVLEKDAKGKVTPVPVKPDGAKTDLPMVVLVNHESASSSEIVAGALQDAKRALLVGEKTFGSGTVLTEVPLSDGSSLMLAIEEMLTPSGRSFWRTGLAPDVESAQALDIDLLAPKSVICMSRAGFQQTRDRQLLDAMKLLRERHPAGS